VVTTTTTALQTPSPPGNLTATAISSSRINLSWTDNSANETGFKIERAAASSGPFSQIAIVGTNVKTYQNTGLQRNTRCYYRVRAYNAAGNSAYSNTASAITLKK
jgi:predicted phage tail protein